MLYKQLIRQGDAIRAASNANSSLNAESRGALTIRSLAKALVHLVSYIHTLHIHACFDRNQFLLLVYASYQYLLVHKAYTVRLRIDRLNVQLPLSQLPQSTPAYLSTSGNILLRPCYLANAATIAISTDSRARV
jgi:hypothetical protein